MIALLATILFASAVTLLLKVATSRGMPVSQVNFFYRAGMGLFALIGLLIHFPLKELLPLWSQLWGYIIPGILLLHLTGTATIHAVNIGHIGISSLVVRAAMVIPVAFSLLLLFRQEASLFIRVLPWVIGGVGFILAGFSCFIREREALRAVAQPHWWYFWLALAFLFQGGWDILVTLTSTLPARQTIFCFYVISLGAGLASSVGLGKREPGAKWQWNLIFYAVISGLFALLVSLIRPFAVRETGGVVAFPLLSIGTILTVQLFGSWFWKQRLGKWGWSGVGLAAIGIILLGISRENTKPAPKTPIQSTAFPSTSPDREEAGLIQRSKTATISVSRSGLLM